MQATRREIGGLGLGALLGCIVPQSARATTSGDPAVAVLATWYRLVLELVRHTPTQSPPVASRAFAYLGVTAFEAMADCDARLLSLGGQVTGLAPLPPAAGNLAAAVVLEAALQTAVRALFANTGPTGQRALDGLGARLADRAAEGQPAAVVAQSVARGRAIAAHVLDWAAQDGGAQIENMGFPFEYPAATGPADWLPTSAIRQQQTPLLPGWGDNRPFVLPHGAACGLPPPPDYSEAPESDFYREALEVVTVRTGLTDEQRAIARFWSDDPMLSPTPPGHWISIALQCLDATKADAARHAEVLALVGIAVADAFIACWQSKYQYRLLRPVTYIRRVIEPGWEPLLNTPPFPEYPSGHSTQSGAAAAVLDLAFGPAMAFEDLTHVDDGLAPRRFAGFWQAAEEAALSRLYGGIHFRAAIERGLEQGRCVAGHVATLRTRAA
ncbi:vanadium-dependent haloperoxidase [Nostoc sp. CHAB 5834]|nr:vanadium-dependent haloperoxidase [Nostoc sp. CHAB 5834]